jgi:hypothetical protein
VREYEVDDEGTPLVTLSIKLVVSLYRPPETDPVHISVEEQPFVVFVHARPESGMLASVLASEAGSG